MELFKIAIAVAVVLCATYRYWPLEGTEALTSTPILLQHDDLSSSHILYLMHTGETAKALQAYQKYRKRTGLNDFELIEQMGLILLHQGYRTRDPETQCLSLFGAGISTNEKALYILEEGMNSGDSSQQIIALNFLSRYQNDQADLFIYRAMASNSALVRLEAAFKLCARKDPRAVCQTEALMAKIPEVFWSIFPQIYAASGSPEAKKILRKLMIHPDETVRIASVLSVAEHGHDDFLPHIRRMAGHHGAAQQEACASTLGLLKDEISAPLLFKLSQSPHIHVKLAACASLYQLGRHEMRKEVEQLAKKGDLFAIYQLREMPGSEETLASLLQNSDIHIKVNAAVALLELGDPRSLTLISQLLIKDTRDLGLGKLASQGTSLVALKAIPSVHQNFEDDPVANELSLHLREALLTKAVELPEEGFLMLANSIFEAQQNDLIPALTEVLENHPTQAVIDLLKKHQQKVGAPLVRNYCNLSLYRLKQPGPYAKNLLDWVTQQQNIDLIQFRPTLPIDQRQSNLAQFELTPHETSRLLVDSFEAFVRSQDDQGIDALISVIEAGNPKNKYALIGLLMRAIQ
jgi:HEAT repeat protein